ncbi:MAG: AzlC family ABC transporter permease [Alphaproteobacteria bacterium]|nr:AzlC family ABC transporter permease [Alphaproteobacteria bacterium]MDX5369311.1 AzlC family ABC transporter permease [Alphaproteobacteria bacterium]MDX5463996.1 AzlC family ABC transporter permease [Alphaproteobacteria bacterium]
MSESVHITRAGMLHGVRLTIPVLPAVVGFGAVFGVVAQTEGLSTLEAVLMSAFVFAGASQYVALELWQDPMPYLAIAIGTFAVNMRFLLMGASMRPWLERMPAPVAYGLLGLLVDMSWLTSMRYRSEGGTDVGIYLGSSLLIMVLWLLGTILGALVGGLIADPETFGLDLVLGAFFASLLVPIWKGPAQVAPWAAAGAVALATAWLAGGYWHIITGALAGAVVAGMKR